MAKRLIRLFGFTIHDAPGEAEAECALLEQQGIVDAVLSEDVDTIMFGCRRTLRNWTAEGTKGSKTPTHVSMYDAAAVAAGPPGAGPGLDRQGMVLVALMSGGDYLPEGVPGCGVKVACEAAKAGFGRDLCRIKRADRDGLAAWKQRLLHELRTNESRYFRTRHKALEIPESFPDMEILRYYTHPVVSRDGTIERLRAEFPPASTVDVVGLRGRQAYPCLGSESLGSGVPKEIWVRRG
jgi:Holliday junction resolvase YEN1